jgi:hypothetical protein
MASSARAPSRSGALPGVSWKAKGRPRSSVRAWIFVVRPPRDRPIALLKAPLLRLPLSDAP